jgi:hypothetical protein
MSDTQAVFLGAFLGVLCAEVNIAAWKWYLKSVIKRHKELKENSRLRR